MSSLIVVLKITGPEGDKKNKTSNLKVTLFMSKCSEQNIQEKNHPIGHSWSDQQVKHWRGNINRTNSQKDQKEGVVTC